MKGIGYALSSEEHSPATLIANAGRAERAGFDFALISDHFHPWISQQGQSSFVWTVLGGIAQTTKALRIGTGVTCPIIRIHPAIVAHAAATTAAMFGGRFFLGLGAGENLNEHILGHRWPRSAERIEMLAEAIEVIRRLWSGDVVSHHGSFYTVDEARLYTLPKKPPPIYVSATGPVAAAMAGSEGDGMIGVAPDKKVLQAFKKIGKAKPTYGQVTLCYARTAAEARRVVQKWWPQTGLRGDLSWETKTPWLFESACKTLSEGAITKDIPCGPDPKIHLKAIREFANAGYQYIYLHQIGPDQEAFFRFFERELRPRL